MSITEDGNSFSWDGTVTVTNATDLNTGVATLILTPAGGIGTLPVLADGAPGPPPIFDSITPNYVAYGTTPSTPTLTLVSAGGSGVASHYTYVFDVVAGAPGDTGTMTIADATDLEGTLGSATDGYTVKWVNADSKFKVVAQLCGDTFNTRTFAAYTGNAGAVTFATLTVAAQPFNWRPTVSGMGIPSGTANTHVDLICRINDATTGDQVGYGRGITGAGSTGIPAYPITLSEGYASTISGGYGMISAGSAATFYFLATQTASTSDAWAIPTTSAYFQVKVNPVPGTN